jgi:hypothetical protein
MRGRVVDPGKRWRGRCGFFVLRSDGRDRFVVGIFRRVLLLRRILRNFVGDVGQHGIVGEQLGIVDRILGILLRQCA